MLTQEITSLNALMGGALLEQFTDAIKQVSLNILDPNTDPKKLRSVSMKITIKPSEQRNNANIECSVDVKLAPPKPTTTSVLIGADMSTGEVTMAEITDQLPGQLFTDGSMQEENKLTIK